tara:strand:- start:989 stop:1267 length:279 start_codon:yes stop_codon:yes gene_type:complete
MNKPKIQIEYDGSAKQKRVEETKGKGSMRTRTMKMVDVKDPRCWEVITVEDTTSWYPGQKLNKKQVEGLCCGMAYNVVIGLYGQFRITNSRY